MHVGAVEWLEPRRLLADSPLRFAVIGDYGNDVAGASVGHVASLVKSWSPDLVITVGDNNYPFGEASTIDKNVGKHYQEYIANYQGDYGAGAIDGVNRFFPSLGNHDWYAAEGAPLMPAPYLNYFTLPGNERYYDFVRGPVHFFAVDSDGNEPDGNTATSLQAQWLKNALSKSISPWNVVYFHHTAYSSGSHGPHPDLQWPFKQWGADVVLMGHDHTYERIIEPATGLPYIINGLGGNSMYPFLHDAPGSVVRYNADFGAMKVDATDAKMTFQFITRGGQLIDSYTLTASTTPPPAPPEVTAVPMGPAQVNLVWQDVAADEAGYVIERADPLTTFRPVAEVGPDVTIYRDRGLLPGVEYRYRVRAFNSAGRSLPTPPAVAPTQPGPPPPLAAPPVLTAVALADGSVSLSWVDVAGEEGYVVEHSPDGIRFTPIADLGAGRVGHFVGGLAANSVHYFRLRAYARGGDSADVNDTVTTLPEGPVADIIDVATDPRESAVNAFTVSFSSPVTGFDLSDLVLSRDGGPNLLGPDQPFISTDGGLTWTIFDVADLTGAPGRYTLVLRGDAASGITDAEGDPLARGAGEAWHMRTAVVAAPLAPDLEAGSDSGALRDDNITNDHTPTFTGAAPAGATVKLYANGVEVGTAVVAADGTYQITTSPLTDGLYSVSARIMDAAGNVSPHSLSTTLRVDRAGPQVGYQSFNGLETFSATVRSVVATFTEDVVVQHEHLFLWNRTFPGQTIGTLTYDRQSHTATWTFPGLPGGLLLDGEYVALLSGITDVAGNGLDGNDNGEGGEGYAFFFHQLAGDANLDRVVNHRDFEVLRQNFGRSGPSSSGDFTGDRLMDFRDFQFLERRFGNELFTWQPRPAPPVPAIASRPIAAKPVTKPRTTSLTRFSARRP